MFEIDDKHLFNHYFQRTDIFSELSEYYNDDEYRFEFPAEDFPRVLELLKKNQYKPIPVEGIKNFAAVKNQYTEYENIFRNSVIHWSRDGYNWLC